MRFEIPRLHRFVVDLFTRLDVAPEHAETTARRLLEADLRGRAGHGVIRVPQYTKRIEDGAINVRPEITLTRETPVSALVDGDNGLGQVVMTRAVETAIDKAEAVGMAWVGAVRSTHAGAAGVYTDLVCRQGMIAIYMAAATGKVMPPWGGRERLLGTNPIAIAVPGGTDEFQLDIATTVTSNGAIKVLAQNGETMPEGWVVDTDGNWITDPALAASGFLMPIGGHKGSGLNMAIGLLAGVLNGAAFGSTAVGRDAPAARESNTGQSILVLRPDLFRDMDDFTGDIDRTLAEMRGMAGTVHIPGDSAKRAEADQRANGVPVSDVLHAQLCELADRYNLADDLS